VINGHTHFRILADDAEDLLLKLVADDPEYRQLAEELLTILEQTVRTSCAAETAQNFLNLFLLWYNMRTFKRGKRAGRSPFQSAGIVVRTPDGKVATDWLEALGYPAE